MNILHLMSQTHLTGPEVYVASLCKRQLRDEHQCYIVSDTLSVKTRAKYIKMSIHNRSCVNRILNIIRLAKLCRAEHIHIIHAHSRAASWLANIVSRITCIAYISTIHGRQGVHLSSKSFNVYGKYIITICEHIRDHLVTELNISETNIRIIRNGID